MISAFVICLDEIDHISECIESLRFCDEVVVVDSGSRDGTLETARKLGARVFEKDWSGYSEQRNYAIDQCQGDWILYMDADERPGPGLDDELREIDRSGSKHDAFEVNSREWFMGRFLGYGGYGLDQPNRKIRFWRRGAARFVGAIHERARVDGSCSRLESHVEHYSTAATVRGLLDQSRRYSTIEAASRLKHAETGSLLRMFGAPLRVFVSRYLRYQGFRDGSRGLIVAALRALYPAQIEAKMIAAALRKTGPSNDQQSARR